MELIIATTNVHKIREIRALLKPLHQLDILSLRDFPEYSQPPETGTTFEENAILKATDAARALNKWAVADDSGLVVPALGGAPGVYSARYAGERAADIDNRRKLLKEMADLEEIGRTAYFECAIALASPKGLKKCVKGICEGMILTKERGRNGFGYDPLFLKHDYNQTFGELEESVKNQVSHRGKALEKLKLILETI
ncbi:MAG: Non-canonical purine NTP pyrophosphatase [Chlamydiae bacterium]|nr:Non-canonical purine NTP pyrophosphatase [Chlamydiota bacterium]